MRGKSNVIERNVEKVWGARYTLGARYLPKYTVIRHINVLHSPVRFTHIHKPCSALHTFICIYTGQFDITHIRKTIGT
jgi:hypothetical protein